MNSKPLNLTPGISVHEETAISEHQMQFRDQFYLEKTNTLNVLESQEVGSYRDTL